MEHREVVVSNKLIMSDFYTLISRIIRFCLYGLAISIPIGNAPVEIFSNIAIALFLIECLTKLFLWLRSSPKQIQTGLLYKPFFIALLCYFIWNGVSVFFSIHAAQSAEAIYTKLSEGILIFFCCMFHIRKKKHLVIFLSCLFFSALLASIDGCVQWFWGKDVIRGTASVIQHDGRRVSGSFKHPNGLGGYLAALLPVMLAVLFDRSRRIFLPRKAWEKWFVFLSCCSKKYLYVVFGLCLVVFGLTFSRGAWLGFGVGLVFLSRRSKKFFLVAVLVFLVFMAVFIPMILANRSIELSFSGIASGRQAFWMDAFHMAIEHPFVGSGLNTYTEFLNSHAETFKGFYAHNCYLQMAVEIGFVGVFFFVCVLILFFYVFLRNIRNVTDSFLGAAAWGMAAGALAFCVHAFFDTIMFSVQLASIHWFLMGLVFAVFRMEKFEV